MSNPLTKDQITEWLKEQNREDPRTWLADQCGVSIRTLNSWFSKRGFPLWALKNIQRIMHDMSHSGDSKVIASFTTDEWELIEEARARLGSPPRPKFYHDSIMAYANGIIEAENKIALMPQKLEEKQLQVADDPATYKAAKKRPKVG